MTSPVSTPSLPTQSSSWIWFFVVLGALAITGIILPILYNVGQQLRPDTLKEAQSRWHQFGPTDYDLSFSIRYDRDEYAERHIVLVRGGRAVFASVEDEIIHVSPTLGATLGLTAVGAPRQRPRDIPTIFAHVAALLDDQERSEGRNFLVVAFDPKNGHPRHIVRRVRHSSTREQWALRLWGPGELETKAKPGGGGVVP